MSKTHQTADLDGDSHAEGNPQTWPISRLFDVAKCQGGSAFSPSLQGRTSGEIPFLKVSDMNSMENRWEIRVSNNYVTKKDASRINGTAKPKGSVIFPKVGAAIHTNKKRFLGNDAYVDNNVLAAWTLNEDLCTPAYLYLYFLTINLSTLSNPGPLPSINNSKVYELEIPLPPKLEQQKIAAVLWQIQRAIATQDRLLAATRDLKAAAMQRLFTRGLSGEALKETEIGPMPQSWQVRRLDTCCDVVNSSLSYTDLANMGDHTGDTVSTFGIKVSDMNLPGNEQQIVHANLERRISLPLARKKSVPANAVVFPKRGAAIATNKKRLTTKWTVLDPNLIGVHAKSGLDHLFLFYWFEQFDLRTITDPGPTPQLNKKNLVPLLLPMPTIENEQRAIAATLATIDRQLAHHRQKRAALNDLFQTSLHKLMTAQLRVGDLDIDTSEIAP